jgi:hypothetical protein
MDEWGDLLELYTIFKEALSKHNNNLLRWEGGLLHDRQQRQEFTTPAGRVVRDAGNLYEGTVAVSKGHPHHALTRQENYHDRKP